MKSFKGIAILSLFITGLLSATPGDSLVIFSDLTFKSDFEKNTFKEFASKGKKTDMIDLFLTSFTKSETISSKNVHEQINDCVSVLKKETEKQSDEKKVKTIYKYIHKRFFKSYKLENSFSDIFETGEYNCVSGSAMYAIVFGMMDIPYQIMEAPQHVFVIAYPNTHKIMIETTSPVNGYFIFSSSYIDKFLKHLNESKIISDEDYKNKSSNELFQHYYYEKKGLSIQELAAIQYCNYTVYHSEKEAHEKALEEIKKAYYIWPGDRNKYILKVLLSNVIAGNDYTNFSAVEKFGMICRFNGPDKKMIADEKIKNEFRHILNIQLVNNSNYSLAEKSYDYIRKNVADTTLKNEITFDYHYEVARLGYNSFREKKYEMPHLKEAYKLKPNHADLQSMIKSYFGKLVEKSDDPVSILKEIKEFSESFSFVDKNPEISSVRADCYLELAYQAFALNDVKKGSDYLSDFEKFSLENSVAKPHEKYVEKAYSTAAGYYYKKGNVKKTKEILKTGIRYAPENFGLRIRLDQLH